jgi:predicted esterase
MEEPWHPFPVSFTETTTGWFRPGPEAAAPLVVLCHSRGEDPREWTRRWPRTLALPVHVVAPRGPFAFEVKSREKTRIGFAWYLYDGGPTWFRETVLRAAAYLCRLLEDLERTAGLAPRERALVGHSQGAYFAYVAALRNPSLFHRLVAAAGRLKEEFVADALRDAAPLRTLILHGAEDRVVSVQAGERSFRALRRAGYVVEKKVLAGGHGVTPETDIEAARWLASGWGMTDPLPE